MREFFKDVYYLPKHPVLKEVYDVIYSSHMTIKSKRDFRDQLSLATEGARHENADVKKYALKRLSDLLSEHQVCLIIISRYLLTSYHKLRIFQQMNFRKTLAEDSGSGVTSIFCQDYQNN